MFTKFKNWISNILRSIAAFFSSKPKEEKAVTEKADVAVEKEEVPVTERYNVTKVDLVKEIGDINDIAAYSRMIVMLDEWFLAMRKARAADLDKVSSQTHLLILRLRSYFKQTKNDEINDFIHLRSLLYRSRRHKVLLGKLRSFILIKEPSF